MTLATFKPYLFVSAGEQSNKFLSPTYAGGIAKFQTQRAQQVNKLLVQIDPVQDLNGQANPYPPGGGKNKLENTAQTATQSGVTFTVNEDGTVSTSGTSTEDANYIVLGVMTLPAGDYVLSGCPSGGSASTFYIIINSGSTASSEEDVRIATDTGSGAEFTLSEATELCVWMGCDNRQVMNNKVFKPMIRLASVTDGTYAPYSNICPISGRTGLTVTAAGVNVWDEEWENGSINDNTGENTAGTGIRSINYISVVPNTSYYFYVHSGAAMRVFFYDIDKTYLSRIDTGSATFTVPTNAYYMRFRSFNAYGTTYNNDISINYPSTDHGYHAYTGTVYPISLGQTVYGGTLDVVSGVLTVTHVYWTKNTATMDNSENYPGWKNSGVKQIVGTSTQSISRLWGNVGTVIGINTQGNNDIVYMPKGNYNDMTQTQWKALGIDVEFAVPLATPQTYQLTPTEVRTIAGFNQIYSDAGPVIDIQF